MAGAKKSVLEQKLRLIQPLIDHTIVGNRILFISSPQSIVGSVILIIILQIIFMYL